MDLLIQAVESKCGQEIYDWGIRRFNFDLQTKTKKLGGLTMPRRKRKKSLVGWVTNCDNLWKFQKAIKDNIKLYDFYHPPILFKQKIEDDRPIKVRITIEEL